MKKKSRDNTSQPFISLKNYYESKDYVVETVDSRNIDQSFHLVFVNRIELNIDLLIKVIRKISFVHINFLVTEEKNVVPLYSNYFLKNIPVDNIYTWRSDIVDSKKIHQYYYPSPLRPEIFSTQKRNLKICSILSGNKFGRGPKKNDLYKFRRYFIKELIKNNILDLYGADWKSDPDEFLKMNSNGPVDSKIKTYKNYTYALCIENSINEIGAVTEKIIDSFDSGSIPLYLGAPNIIDLIPSSTYIDLRQYRKPQNLILFLNSLSEDDIINFQMEIKKFKNSKEYLKFCSPGFVRYITRHNYEILRKKSHLVFVLKLIFSGIFSIQFKSFWILIKNILKSYVR